MNFKQLVVFCAVALNVSWVGAADFEVMEASLLEPAGVGGMSLFNVDLANHADVTREVTLMWESPRWWSLAGTRAGILPGQRRNFLLPIMTDKDTPPGREVGQVVIIDASGAVAATGEAVATKQAIAPKLGKVIDGDLSDWPDAQTWGIASDEGAPRLGFAWDEQYLYVAIDTPAMGTGTLQIRFAGATWNAVSTQREHQLETVDYALTMTADGPRLEQTARPAWLPDQAQDLPVVAVEAGEGRQLLEVALPWSRLLPVAPREDLRFGLTIGVAESWSWGLPATGDRDDFCPLQLKLQ